MALGILETRGFTGATEALDEMCKVAVIQPARFEEVGGGHMIIMVEGETAAVASAIETGKRSVESVGVLISANVIPNPHEDLKPFYKE